MKYHISRTSHWDDNAPCEEAFQEEYDKWETRTVSEEEFDKRFGPNEGTWRSEGTQHGTHSNGWVTRKRGKEKIWVVEIKDLVALMNFTAKYGKVIVHQHTEWETYRIPSLEIYDDYRE